MCDALEHVAHFKEMLICHHVAFINDYDVSVKELSFVDRASVNVSFEFVIITKSVMHYHAIDKPHSNSSGGCDGDIGLENVLHIGDESAQDVRFAYPSASKHCYKKLRAGVQCLDVVVERGFLC